MIYSSALNFVIIIWMSKIINKLKTIAPPADKIISKVSLSKNICKNPAITKIQMQAKRLKNIVKISKRILIQKKFLRWSVSCEIAIGLQSISKKRENYATSQKKCLQYNKLVVKGNHYTNQICLTYGLKWLI